MEERLIPNQNSNESNNIPPSLPPSPPPAVNIRTLDADIKSLNENGGINPQGETINLAGQKPMAPRYAKTKYRY